MKTTTVKLSMRLWMWSAILAVICCGCAITRNSSSGDTPSDSSKEEVRIAIAWRADPDNEFCTNIIEAFREAGITVTVLPQVKAGYLDYTGNAVAATNLDAEGIGYLNSASGTMLRLRGCDSSNAAEVLSGVDGVIFTGGEDIAPTLLATPQDWHHIESEIDYNPARDVSDFLTMTYCLDHDIPLIGFCRGAQMLGVVSGATLIQDIPTWFSQQGLSYNYEHRREKAEGETYRDYTPHDVTLSEGSTLARFFGTTTLTGCPSWHHQALQGTEGTPLRVTATTTVSGIDMVEGVERTDKRCAVGVQFHPEAAIVKHTGKAVNNENAGLFMAYDAAIPLFPAFIEVCKNRNNDDSSGFVAITDVVPDAILEIRYYGTYNFVGARIDGYQAPTALLTKEAAAALKDVSDDVIAQGYRLKIYDAYRPQKGVDHFVRWAADVADTKMKPYFYPDLDKGVLFEQEYIMEKSGHTRGSTVDLTLFDMASEKELDMGGTFDWFGPESHPDFCGNPDTGEYTGDNSKSPTGRSITGQQFHNRMILRKAMLAHGFKPLDSEWWHFTLKDEPYPDTYFTFPVQ